MARARDPRSLAQCVGLSPAQLEDLGVLNPTVAIDTKLFIDPLLLGSSAHAEIRTNAADEYRSHFEQAISLLAATTRRGDVAWRAARRLLTFHEIRGTCLGYGAGSIEGTAFGQELTERVLTVGKEIVDLGVRDPDLFQAMALFEEDIGPDRISDMTTNVIRKALVRFNRRALQSLGLKGEAFALGGVPGEFLVNPSQRKRTPVILVPLDILRELPIARDWDGIASAAARNAELRDRVNKHVAHIWAAKTKRDKQQLRAQALGSRRSFQTLLEALHEVPRRPYDAAADRQGLLGWATTARQLVGAFPLSLEPARSPIDLDAAEGLVKQIVGRFRQLVELNGLNRELYRDDGRPRHESTAQRLFFAVAFCYCEANNLDLSPEVDTGSGKVDFKISQGREARVLVEIKLSTNPAVVRGYTAQLEVYKAAQQTRRAFYVVIDVGGMGKKLEELAKIRNAARSRGEPLSELEVVDGIAAPPASKRR